MENKPSLCLRKGKKNKKENKQTSGSLTHCKKKKKDDPLVRTLHDGKRNDNFQFLHVKILTFISHIQEEKKTRVKKKKSATTKMINIHQLSRAIPCGPATPPYFQPIPPLRKKKEQKNDALLLI